MISGLPKLREMGVVPAVVFAVGASPAFEEVLTQMREQNQLGETPLFYFEGGVDFNKLGFVQRMMLKTMKKMTEKKKDMTRQERHLWYDFLKSLPFTVHRQKIIGHYIVDFYVPSAKLVIELDGSQHYEPAGQMYDARRSAYLEQQGIQVLRFSNSDVLYHLRGVCEVIDTAVSSRTK